MLNWSTWLTRKKKRKWSRQWKQTLQNQIKPNLKNQSNPTSFELKKNVTKKIETNKISWQFEPNEP